MQVRALLAFSQKCDYAWGRQPPPGGGGTPTPPSFLGAAPRGGPWVQYGPASQLMLVLVLAIVSGVAASFPRLLLQLRCAGRPGPRGSPPVAMDVMWS